jgi:flavin-binding protein dodecin
MRSVVKVVGLFAESDPRWEQAAQDAVAHVSQTIRSIKTCWMHGAQGWVENNRTVKYRVNPKI